MRSQKKKNEELGSFPVFADCLICCKQRTFSANGISSLPPAVMCHTKVPSSIRLPLAFTRRRAPGPDPRALLDPPVMPFAPITAPRVSVVGKASPGRRSGAPKTTRANSQVSILRGPSRGSRLHTSAFGFGKKSAPEPEEEEEEEETDAVDGNPFASVGGKVNGAKGSEDPPKGGLKLPSLGGFKFPGSQKNADEYDDEEFIQGTGDETDSGGDGGNPFASFGGLGKLPKIDMGGFNFPGSQKKVDEYDDEDFSIGTSDETEPTKSGNPFASFGAFGNMGKTIDQTVDLDYEDEEEEETESKGNPFGGFALPSFGGGGSRENKKEDAPEKPSAKSSKKEEPKLGNWERTLKENVKDSETPTWTMDPEPVRGASLQKFKLESGDVKVIGRDKGPGIDVVAKVGCVSGVHCQLEMEGNRLYVTDLGSTNGTYVDGQEMRKNNRYRVFNGASLRLGAENTNGEPFVTYEVALTGANEMAKNSEYGQVQALVEALGGPKVVGNFFIINVFFQLGFYVLLQMQTE